MTLKVISFEFHYVFMLGFSEPKIPIGKPKMILGRQGKYSREKITQFI